MPLLVAIVIAAPMAWMALAISRKIKLIRQPDNKDPKMNKSVPHRKILILPQLSLSLPKNNKREQIIIK